MSENQLKEITPYKHIMSKYDIKNYLRNVDFNLIYSNIKKMTEKKLAN